MIASLSRVRRLEPRFFGPIRSSDVDSRAFHLAIVLRLTPYCLARTVFFSSLAWIARRSLGVVVAQECVRICARWLLGARWLRFGATRISLELPCTGCHAPDRACGRSAPVGKAAPAPSSPVQA